MQNDPFGARSVSSELINDALDYVFESAIAGNYNFFVLVNSDNNHFIQTVFEDGMWHIEYAQADSYIYQREELEYKKVSEAFQNFFNKIPPELSAFQKINIKDL